MFDLSELEIMESYGCIELFNQIVEQEQLANDARIEAHHARMDLEFSAAMEAQYLAEVPF